MRKGMVVVDVDSHFLEPLDSLVDYMPEPVRYQVRESGNHALFIPTGLGDRTVAGRITRPEFPRGGSRDPNAIFDIEDVKQRLGVDAFIFISTQVFNLAESSQRHVVNAYYAAYMDYMVEHIASPARGAYLMIPIAWQDPEAAAALIHRHGDNPAVVGICMVGPTTPLGEEPYNQIYQAAQDHDLPVIFHAAVGPIFIKSAPLVGDFQKLVEGHWIGFTVSNMVQLTSCILQGIPERFPQLKLVFQESGIFWIPMTMYRLDEYFLKRRSEAPLLKQLPSDYVRESCWFGTQPLEVPRESLHLQAAIEMIGVDRLLFASDYPHWDYDDPAAVLQLDFLAESQKAAILGDNARRVFNFRREGVQPWENTLSPALAR